MRSFRVTLSTKKLKNSRYRRDPIYRQSAITRAKLRIERIANDPVEKRLVQLRKDRWRIRESLIARINHVERLEKRLNSIIVEITKLEKERES